MVAELVSAAMVLARLVVIFFSERSGSQGGKKQSTDGLQRLLIYHDVRGGSLLTPQGVLGLCVTSERGRQGVLLVNVRLTPRRAVAYVK
jgi:hypothetical protein